jgi:hypothetical protein
MITPTPKMKKSSQKSILLSLAFSVITVLGSTNVNAWGFGGFNIPSPPPIQWSPPAPPAVPAWVNTSVNQISNVANTIGNMALSNAVGICKNALLAVGPTLVGMACTPASEAMVAECAAAATASGIPEAMAPVCVVGPAAVYQSCRFAAGSLGLFSSSMMGSVAEQACSKMTGR